MLEKLRLHKLKILVGILGILIFAGAVFGAYKLGQRQVQPVPQPTPVGQRGFCKSPRPEICTMECVAQPPYICGSDGKFYCNKCSACADQGVDWYMIQDTPCSR